MRRYRDMRFLRSDGRPNFSSRIYEREGELEEVMSRPAVTITKTAPIRECIKLMSSSGYRRIPVTAPTGELVGIVSALDIVSYLGGGEYYGIVVRRHKGNFFAVLEEPVESIMTKGIVKANYGEKISDVLEKMIKYNVGGLPVTDSRNRVVGMVTERDILRYAYDALPDTAVSEVMTRDVKVIEVDSTLRDAMREMVKTGFRRLPIISHGRVIGMLSAMDIVRFFASSEPYRYITLGRLEEVTRIKITDIASTQVYYAKPDESVKSAVNKMFEYNVGCLLVMEGEKIEGIVTERDVLISYAMLS